ncbi:hypothetical protein Q0812_08175 [Brevundimonas sp. 2R-24]|uniref:DUF885 domain-containing protein n=1 Tax=Peiella sedimenti TaxID=3061083 RepID=A0ABT8SP87_9CAUL|nr:hypothetical protein [Caulobacteraceae bacterium XZ-24]
MVRAVLLCLTLVIAACASAPPSPPPPPPLEARLNAVAEDYVKLMLEIDTHEEGYVDAYYGPSEWREAARANPRSVNQLMVDTAAVIRALEVMDNQTAGADPDLRRRQAYLKAHASAALARLRMISGERLSFADEAHALFGVRPELRPLESYRPVLNEIDALLPGDGPLYQRVAAFKARYVIPRDRLRPMFEAAIAECKARTERRIGLPAGESFELEFVTDKPWSGYNWYRGGSQSLIQINTDLPIYIDRALDLGCHEGYPGHHVYNALLERAFVRERGWLEMSVYPLYSPMSFIAEGSANYGIDLAFPGPEKTAFEQRVLYPLAGLDPAMAPELQRLLDLTRRLGGAEYTIADAYLAGRIDRAEAQRLLQEYQLSDPARAAQRVRFIDTYRSYIINYGLGRDTVQTWVERQGPDHWDAMETLLASQTLPVDLLP